MKYATPPTTCTCTDGNTSLTRVIFGDSLPSNILERPQIRNSVGVGTRVISYVIPLFTSEASRQINTQSPWHFFLFTLPEKKILQENSWNERCPRFFELSCWMLYVRFFWFSMKRWEEVWNEDEAARSWARRERRRRGSDDHPSEAVVVRQGLLDRGFFGVPLRA